jgi:hypothetical protein
MAISCCTFAFIIFMKPLSYYQKISVSIPRRQDYTTTYYYRKGVMVEMKVGKHNDDFQPPDKCVEEYDLDEVSYNAHIKLYQDESIKLQNEFRKDLILKYEMNKHPKANVIFDKAWDIGCSSGLQSVEYYFTDIMDLFDDESGQSYNNNISFV